MPKLIKRLLCVLAICVLIVGVGVLGHVRASVQTQSAPQQQDEPECYQHGDVNSDGDVTTDDAFYILYHDLIGEDIYPIRQQWDFNEDTQTDLDDAFHILYHELVDEELYGLKGTIHNYYDPVWAWSKTVDGATAQVTFKCGCGQPAVYTVENGVSVTLDSTVEASCVQAGVKAYSAVVTVDGQQYSATYDLILPAGNGHDIDEATCEAGASCKNGCGYSIPALGHSWALEKAEAATCSTDAYEVYRCGTCSQTKTETQTGTATHTMQYLRDVQEGCKYTKWYKCVNCDHEEAGATAADVYYNHNYTATLTKEATCVSEGEKTYKCACNASYTEPIAINDSHAWQEGATVDGVTTHTCQNTGCTATKTTVKADAPLDTQTLTNELQLDNGASMVMDQETVAALDAKKKIEISVEPLEKNHELMDKLTAEQKEQIGDNTVYDFNMAYSNGEKISDFAGSVTISLPYELQPGDDIDSIDVWFISDDGQTTRVTGTYSNKMVTFTTTHFSYYTVTRLTPEQRCERYGHLMVSSKKKATCTADGYDMELCQRCGHVEKNDVLERTGHNYTRTTKAATCDQAGSFTEVCGNCQKTVTGVIPALGHTMVADPAQTVQPTCTAAGKTVSVCSREGCTHKQEDALPQLAHQYATFEVFEADCTNKGYETRKCNLCGDEVTVNEVAPLGHNYDSKNVTWNWGKDHQSATVTLVCTHDAEHTKVMNAVITTEDKEASCTMPGGTVITATASWNQTLYTDSYTEAVPAGHKPAAAWEKDDNQHYHICTVCGEQVDKTKHTLDDGVVINAPTCGEKGDVLYTCTVCDHQVEKKLPATNNHVYENGACTGCGKEETDCLHLKTGNKTELDLSAYNICEGTQVIKYSCDCGENVTYTYELGCDMDYDVEPEKVVINGQEVNKYTYVCEDCGLVSTAVEYSKKTEGQCTLKYVVDIAFSKDDVTIMETEILMGVWYHGPSVLLETVDLTTEEYGLCSEILEIYSCGCELNVISVEEKERCDWRYIAYEDNANLYVCADPECGAQKKLAYNEDFHRVDKCTQMETSTWSYYVDGEEVYSVVEQDAYVRHEWEVVDYELSGDSCEDGLYYIRQCKHCDATEEEYTDYHEMILSEYVDLSSYNVCPVGLKKTICPCGQAYDSELDYGDGEGCDDDKVGCSICGLRKEYDYEENIDDNCVMRSRRTITYYDAQGNQIAVGGYASVEFDCHDMRTQESELLGENCEAGVKTLQVCDRCGYQNRYTYYGHQTSKTEEYDLSQYGMCGGKLVFYACACHENAYDQWEYGGCSWSGEDQVQTENGYIYYYKCYTCNARYVRTLETLPDEDPCRSEELLTYVFYAGDSEEPVLTASYTTRIITHDLRASFRLNNESMGCEGGYTVTETCQSCDFTDTYETSDSGEHSQYVVDKKVFTAEGMCEKIEVTYYECACGRFYSTEVQTVEGECNWRWFGPNTYICETCQAQHTTTNRTEDVEGNSCRVRWIETYAFSRDGQALFSYDYIWNSDAHAMIYTFEMMGPTCDSGFQAHGTCQTCGEQSTYWDYGHFSYPVSRETKISDPAMCSDVELVYNSCPCGKHNTWSMASRCDVQNMGYDESGNTMYCCSKCSAQWVQEISVEEVFGSCQINRNVKYTYTVGENTYTITYAHVDYEHNVIFDFVLQGDSCTDGYTAYQVCTYCDYREYWGQYSGHEKYQTAYYELSRYGACDGRVYAYSCPCGQECTWSWDGLSCRGTYANMTIPGTNLPVHKCEDCGLYYGWGEVAEKNKETCTVDGTFYYYLSNDEEVILSVEGETVHEDHEAIVIDAKLLNPNGNCENGYIFTWQCVDCQKSWTSEGNDHASYLKESIDLAQYGSTCGGKLEVHGCICGENQSINENGWDCDRGQTETTLWIENTVTGTQDNADGWHDVNSRAWIEKCAVTDPECGLTIRVADYWLRNGCYITNYVTWQLGYDEQTGTCQKEITVKGETRLFHDYTRTELTGEKLSGYHDVCKICQSEYLNKNFSDDQGYQASRIEEMKHTLDDGRDRYYIGQTTYVKIGTGTHLKTYRHERTYADGSKFWYEEVFDYHPESCSYTVTHTDSNGDNYEIEGQAHVGYENVYDYKAATCSQPGYNSYWYGCIYCGTTINENLEIYEPGHNWNQNGEIYECSVCGLKNKNGADGDIILEDMTSSKGESENYVIGYYNPKEIPFVINVSVILDDVTDADNQIDLGITEFTYKNNDDDGYVGVAFNKAQADEAAANAVADRNYTGSYAIRVSIVPAGGDNTLDYAITFDSVTAQ